MRRHADFTAHKYGLGSAGAAGASIALAFLLSVSSASAGTDIQGTADDLQLNVQNATLVEVLNALSGRFNITFKARSHNPRVLTGAYSGTLRETLTRVLDGNDYILERSDGGFEITILGASATEQQNTAHRPVAAAAPVAAPAPAPTTAARPSVASSKPVVVPNPNQSVSTAPVPPLSSFAVVPSVTP